MPPPLYMGSRPWPVLLGTVMMLALLPVGAEPADTEADNGSGALLDAAVLDANCLENGTCEGHRPDHLIEYFSADWCEPCEQVSEQLRNMTNPHHVILQHHPSPEDSTFLSASKLRNDADYRLLFLPSLVIDGEHLLTGTRQAMDMNETLDAQGPAWGGLQQVEFSNETLRWNASVNGTVAVWLTAPVPHETSGIIHPSVAYRHHAVDAQAGELALNSSQFAENTTLVVLLEREGVRTLNVASLAPTGQVDLNTEPEIAQPQALNNDALLPVLVTLLLMLALAPAIVSHIRLLRRRSETTSEENGSED